MILDGEVDHISLAELLHGWALKTFWLAMSG